MMTLGIICEELAKGDAGISLSAGINAGLIVGPEMIAGNKAVLERFATAFCGESVNYACLSMTDYKGAPTRKIFFCREEGSPQAPDWTGMNG
jgi:hypothetical protein